ncbi:MAG TPA: divergent polysaccharide deacetylase family protein, partial [Brevundimonas diminuta]|nr:divergent polysaccharide deacetylase family protein [Brevundimonas diminuta]HRL25718.1 divergent polysaccharide deacetylase family protein [Brevundimonas diminuta]
MFAKRQSALAAAAGAPPEPRSRVAMEPVLNALKKPPVAAGAAGVFVIGAAALFVAVLGDPRAGAPTASAVLERPVAADTAPTGAEAFGFSGLDIYQDLGPIDPALMGEGGAAGGEALITLPDGASVASGQGFSAPVRAPSNPLPKAPIAGLFQPGPNGPLPRIAVDGRVPAQAYARPFRSNGKPMVALVVGGLGLNSATTRAAIERLPAEVTLSFVPYAEGLQTWIDMARAHGHEVMIELPMEPTGYPDNDPGPYTLLSSGGADDVAVKLDWLLARATGYFGVTNYLGDRFATSDEGVSALMTNLRQRGLAFLDDGSMRRRPGAFARASADRVVDEEQTPAAILR